MRLPYPPARGQTNYRPPPSTDTSDEPASRATLGRLELRSPPLPQTLFEALSLVEHPDKLDVKSVTEMVAHDPIVVARLLQTVNSSYYGLQRTISNAERAVVLIGSVAVTGIVVGMNMMKLSSVLEGPGATCFSQLIRHSVATAFLTRHILYGNPRGRVDDSAMARRTGVSFTAGLLHDFGKIILVYNFPRKAMALYEEQTLAQQVNAPNLLQLEQLLFGYDHTETGEYAARKLNFPDSLVDIIRRHHDADVDLLDLRAGANRLLAATVAANLTAKAMGHAFTRSVEWSACMDDPVWDLLISSGVSHLQQRDELFDDLQAQQEHLDSYVQRMTMTIDEIDVSEE